MFSCKHLHDFLTLTPELIVKKIHAQLCYLFGTCHYNGCAWNFLVQKRRNVGGLTEQKTLIITHCLNVLYLFLVSSRTGLSKKKEGIGFIYVN